MAKYELLNNVAHQDLRVITDRSAEFGDSVSFTMCLLFEFRNVQAHYPILFQRDGEGQLYPVALFGFQEGENLFLSEDGWSAGYVPAMIQRQPFLIGFQESRDPAEAGHERMMSIDMEHPRVSTERGEALFQPLGGRTPYLENAANLLETIYEGYQHNRAFVEALQEHDLIESITVSVTLDDGSSNEMIGFYGLNEEKIQELSGDVLEQFSKSGFLMPVFMILASMGNIRKLVDVKNAQLEADAQ